MLLDTLAADFDVLDTWQVPVRGDRDDLARRIAGAGQGCAEQGGDLIDRQWDHRLTPRSAAHSSATTAASSG